MPNMIYLTGSRMNALVDNLEVIAANLANANTPGFKRTVGKFKSVLQRATWAPVSGPRPITISPDWPELSRPRTDFSQGPIRRTGRSLDLAIRGDAFFVVETPAGRRYTRKGRLYLNAAGELTDGAGNHFASESGRLQIPEGAGYLTVDPTGQVGAGEQIIGRLMLVDIPEPEALVAEGSSNFRNDGAPSVSAVGSQVMQGAIEQSNVSAVQEMVALIGVMRAYEASARIVKRLDSLSARLIQAAA